MSNVGVCGWQKMTSVWFCKKPWFSVRFRFYKINGGFSFSVCFFCTMCCLMCMTYFRAKLAQLIVSRSDSEPDVQRYDMKKNTLTVYPITLEDKLWMRQHEKTVPKPPKTFLWVFRFEFWGQFGSVFRKPISDIFTGFRTPLVKCLPGTTIN